MESDKCMSYLQLLAASIVRMGPIPQHIAIIMDGNRRYAASRGMKAQYGHEAGAELLNVVRTWGKAIGCKELTLYVFSSENYKRTVQEVEDLMDLIFRKFTTLLEEIESGENTDTCIQMIGNWEKFPLKLKYRMATLMARTKHFTPYKLNFAVGYTGREGILKSLNSFHDKSNETSGNYDESFPAWNEYSIGQSQHLVDMRPIDVLIRTGGDQRLSDFMMWESTHAYIHFMKGTWPEFSFWKFIHSCFLYQVHKKKIVQAVWVKVLH
ncbi:dehydrodolichyl diphosphate synthase complex subunit DHDDS-like [Folsomia candida]|uniref:dehydrodolichyl diphosphate synthase complex subunit DHDDS-like n=1 Tax=Folsomia candida TaxID=158441 RepID=UPI001604DC6C|nr:dehydrodolichyl diphosphate synthase complex subunit DHDDS-like [Folsomia candida]